MASKEEGAAVPPQSKGSWSSFLRSIASFNGDLSSMTAPPFILSSTSLVEYSSYWAEHPSIFAAPALEKDPQKRALAVLKWFLSTLKQHYSSRSEKLGSEKKPLNPFLGELFLGEWEDEAGTTKLVSEQVSHHPPVTAYCIWNKEKGVQLQGYNAQKASFSRTINVKQVGHALLHLAEFDEDYLITLPPLYIEGLITGSPYVELDKKTYITSSSGYTSCINYSGRGWLSGKKNTFSASLYQTSKEKDVLYTAEGQWNESYKIKDAKSKDVIEEINANEIKTTPLKLKPTEEQDELESRRAWKNVAKGIESGDMDMVSREKSAIENNQRELRRKEKEEGREWERRYFRRVDRHARFEELADKVGAERDEKQTNGVWVFDEKHGKNLGAPLQAKESK
ncbi:oxysterol binding protein-like protein [Viridothelium virens]|uniref:Oxysterol binding protein-like protein n=1 Tax=Viridothelium virens TaxID=1048519 RepID=A0A6A6H228_VIRVR|nr:oxysterol binding protein-like protein [Viridothelium virens]